ncbi:heat-inducible transcriptional repressor HrcA [Synechocystis sp. LKSZ1]|uniref:heat-inducible transcriptional repressor HrcA n=1 Tax=Synechocystis sp. LKSZ1 TaxID=3144951 RepID=UPI00336BEE13
MFNAPPLSERHQNILRATIQHYIATAEPVGSKTLVEEYKFSVSSATIRHALGHLEKAGLLYQPHISAGRIPSDWGYRLYVEQLINLDNPNTETVKQSLQQKLQGEHWNFEILLQRAAQILAGLSGCIALVTFPQTQVIQLRHLQLVQISGEQIVVILVTDSYQTHSLSLDLPISLQEADNQELLEQELQILSNFLNHKLRGQRLSQLASLNWQELGQEFACYADFLQGLLQQLQPFFRPSPPSAMVIHGVSEVIRQPEFSQLDQVHMLLHLLEQEQDQLFPVIFDVGEGPGPARPEPSVTLRIGAENPLESMRPCTLISAFYRQGHLPVGSVSVIGPTRMLYEQVIPLVESTADYLSATLSG